MKTHPLLDSLREHDLSVIQGQIIYAVGHAADQDPEKALSTRDIAAQLQTTRSLVSRQTFFLSSGKTTFVRVRPSKKDKRRVEVSLTPAGRKFYQRSFQRGEVKHGEN